MPDTKKGPPCGDPKAINTHRQQNRAVGDVEFDLVERKVRERNVLGQDSLAIAVLAGRARRGGESPGLAGSNANEIRGYRVEGEAVALKRQGAFRGLHQIEVLRAALRKPKGNDDDPP